MDFPVHGDADSYRIIGQSCADFITGSGEGVTGTCYNAVRPIGIMVYNAIPFLLTKDTLDQNYIVVLLNLAFFMLLVASLLVLFKNLSGAVAKQNRWATYVGGTVLLAFTLVLCVAFIPVRLSDIQSLACFTASVAILSSESNRRHFGALFVSGLLAGLSVLLKQNYVMSIFFLVVFWCCFDFKVQLENRFKHIFLYLIGVSICLLQVFAAYYHSGVPWFYEPAAMAVYDSINYQPYVELVAYTDPIRSAYVSKLASEVTQFQFVAVKFYEGMMKFYWPVYIGKAPFDITPEVLVISEAKLFYMQLTLVVMGIATLLTAFFKNKWIAVVSFMTTASIFLTTVILHTENRYFLMTKIYLILMLAVVFVRLVNKYVKRSSAAHDSVVE